MGFILVTPWWSILLTQWILPFVGMAITGVSFQYLQWLKIPPKYAHRHPNNLPITDARPFDVEYSTP